MKEPPEEAERLRAKRTGFLTPVQLLIKEIVGVSQGGDAQSAQISAMSRKSRFVRNVVRTLLQADEPLVLLGDPGTGKSLTLQQAALIIAANESRRLFPIVCLFIRLGEFQVSGTIGAQSVWEFVKKSTPAAVQPYLDGLMESGRLVILFDGMDEMSRQLYNEHTSALSVFAGSRKESIKTLFSCRIADFTPKFQHRRLVLLPFGRTQIYQYLKRQVPRFPLKVGDRMWTASQLARRFTEADLPIQASNPFVLWLLCNYLLDEKDWPKSRIHLLEYYVRRNYERKMGEPRGEASDVETALLGWGHIAHEITTRNRGATIPLEVVKGFLQPEESGVVTAGLKCGVLEESLDLDTELLRFEHHRFEEFFTAYWLSRNEQVRSLMTWLEKLDAPRWQDTLFNLVLMGCGQEALRALRAAIEQGVEKLALFWAIAPSATNAGGEEERLLADRMDLAARVLQQVLPSPDTLANDLFDTFREAAYTLTDKGNPITQVKVLWACRVVAGVDIFRAARGALDSEVEWARRQALIITSSVGGEVSGQALKEDVLYSFATGKFLQRFAGYVRIASALKQKRVWLALAAGLVFSIAPLLAEMGLVFETRRITQPVLTKSADQFVTVAVRRAADDESKLERENTAFHRLRVRNRRRDVITARESARQVRESLPLLIDSRLFSVALAAVMVLAALFAVTTKPGLQMLAVGGSGLAIITISVTSWFLWSPSARAGVFQGLALGVSIMAGALWMAAFAIQTVSLICFSVAAAPWTGRNRVERALLVDLWQECGFAEVWMNASTKLGKGVFWAWLYFLCIGLVLAGIFTDWLEQLASIVRTIGLFGLLPPLLNILVSLSLYIEGVACTVTALIFPFFREPMARARSLEILTTVTFSCFGFSAASFVIWGSLVIRWALVFGWLGRHIGLFPSLPLAINILFSIDAYAAALLILAPAARMILHRKEAGSRPFIPVKAWLVCLALFAGIVFGGWRLTLADWEAIGTFLLRFAVLRSLPTFLNIVFSLILYVEVIGCSVVALANHRSFEAGQRIWDGIRRWSMIPLVLALTAGLLWCLFTFGEFAARIAALLLTGSVVVLIAYMSSEVAKGIRPLVVYWRAQIGSRYAPQDWAVRLGELDAESQAALLRRTTAESLGLRTEAYLKLLQSVALLVKSEPAASAYWATRYQIEEIVRQEQTG